MGIIITGVVSGIGLATGEKEARAQLIRPRNRFMQFPVLTNEK